VSSCFAVDGWYGCVQSAVGDGLEDWRSKGNVRSHILSFSLLPISTHPSLLSGMKRVTHKVYHPYQKRCLPIGARPQ
jgi:hypothetical protein